eukprot:356613-Chlamydomonas_euryale.AAC.5
MARRKCLRKRVAKASRQGGGVPERGVHGQCKGGGGKWIGSVFPVRETQALTGRWAWELARGEEGSALEQCFIPPLPGAGSEASGEVCTARGGEEGVVARGRLLWGEGAAARGRLLWGEGAVAGARLLCGGRGLNPAVALPLLRQSTSMPRVHLAISRANPHRRHACTRQRACACPALACACAVDGIRAESRHLGVSGMPDRAAPHLHLGLQSPGQGQGAWPDWRALRWDGCQHVRASVPRVRPAGANAAGATCGRQCGGCDMRTPVRRARHADAGAAGATCERRCVGRCGLGICSTGQCLFGDGSSGDGAAGIWAPRRGADKACSGCRDGTAGMLCTAAGIRLRFACLLPLSA